MNPRIRVFDTSPRPVVIIDRWYGPVSQRPDPGIDGAVLVWFACDVDVDTAGEAAGLAREATVYSESTGTASPALNRTTLTPPVAHEVLPDAVYRARPGRLDGLAHGVGGGSPL